ncbi:MAG: hypothetical protein V1761_03500 [bacterium]
MPNNAIRQLVEMDKTAREKVAAHQKERDEFDLFVQETEKKLLAERTEAAQKTVAADIERINKELTEKKTAMQAEYQAVLLAIDQLYQEKKNEWIEAIYQACIK